jgi:hypothetical protein
MSRIRFLAYIAIVLVLATAIDALAANRVPTRSIPSTVPTLRGAVAVGTLVALDPKADVAEFRIRCGWYARRGKPTEPEATVAQRKLHPGLWKVGLRGLGFNAETYPSGPASGIAHNVALHTWERSSVRAGWTGTVFLASGWNKPFLSDGPDDRHLPRHPRLTAARPYGHRAAESGRSSRFAFRRQA